MSTNYDVTFGPSHTSYSNVNSDGSISIPANDIPVLVATVPLGTGIISLDINTLQADIFLSVNGFTNDGTLSSQYLNYRINSFQGNPTLSSISSCQGSVVSAHVQHHTYNVSPGDYYEIVRTINSSGNLLISIKGLSSGSKACTFRNLQISYRIFGYK